MKTITLNKCQYHLYYDDNIFINQHCDIVSVRNINHRVAKSTKTGDYLLNWSNHRANITLEYYRAKDYQEDTLVIDGTIFYKVKSIPRENDTKIVHIFSDRENAYSVIKVPLAFQYKHPIPLETDKLKSIFRDNVVYFDHKKAAYKSQIAKLHSIVNNNAQARA